MIKMLISGACGVTSRSIVRSLNKSEIFKGKIDFIGTDICNLKYAPYEGLYKKVYYVPRFDDAQYTSIMQKIIDENEIECAIVIPEPESLFWSQHPFNVKFMRIPPHFGEEVLSKKRLYENLEGTGLIPKFQVISQEDILKDDNAVRLDYPMWIRDYSEGTTSGKGAYLAHDYKHLCAWVEINENIDTFMLAEFLPGRNLACFLSYNNGELIQYGVAERIDYLMGKVAVSGITGNTSYGRLLNDKTVFDIALKGVNKILEKTGETMHGLVVVDLKENSEGVPMITEVNLRHVAFTSTFANAGLNFAEAQLLCMLGRENEIPVRGTKVFSENNAMLRDVDGLPIYVEDFHMPKLGNAFKVNTPPQFYFLRNRNRNNVIIRARRIHKNHASYNVVRRIDCTVECTKDRAYHATPTTAHSNHSRWAA